MKSNYKIGDRVVCIDDSNSSNLAKYCEYEVVAVNEYGNIQVAEGDYFVSLPHFYRPLRFDLIETKQKTNKNKVKAETKSFDCSKKYHTQSGEQWRFIGMGSCEEYPVVGEYFSEEYDAWQIDTWTLDGKMYQEEYSDRDISVIPEEVKIAFGGINITVYDDKSVLFGDTATDNATIEEIDNLIAALNTFKQII